MFLIPVLMVGLMGGCSSVKEYPQYDQVLMYDRPYDYTYLKVIEAVNTIPEWTVEETDQVKGLIVLRNTAYGHMFDHDKWVVQLDVRRMGQKQTSVSLKPESQQNEKGGFILERIDYVMGVAATMKGEKLAEVINY